MHWNLALFQSLYNSIEAGGIDTELFKYLLEDLQGLNLNEKFPKNTASRTKLEKGEISLEDGSTYKLSQDFIAATIKLSDELNLDELVAAELILSSFSGDNSLQNDNYNDMLLVKNGKVQYYLRRQYILQIAAYIVACMEKDDVVYTQLSSGRSTLFETILSGLGAIHKELVEIKQSINRAQILDTDDSLFQQNVKFRRDFLLREYDALGQLLFNAAKKNPALGKQYTLRVLEHVSSMDLNDFFQVYYLPTIFYLFQNLEEMPDEDVRSLHSKFLSDLKSETLYTKPFQIFTIFVFLSFFISWCKRDPETRAKRIDFRTEIDIPMTMSTEMGAIEQLLVFAADTSDMESSLSTEIFYDIRSLLQRHLPRLVPVQLMDTKSTSTSTPAYSEPVKLGTMGSNAGNNDNSRSLGSKSSNEKNGFSYRKIKLSSGMREILLHTFNGVLQTVISDCAFLLTRIKDSEEDSLLSGEDLSLDDVAVKADLERFFLSIYYFYASRPHYAEQFWQDKESSAYGFVEWSTKCTDPLMRSCFYYMISSLACGNENGTHVFHYFGETSPVSWASIAQHINDYVGKITNLSTVIQQRQQIQDTVEITGTEVALEEGLNEEAIILLSSLLTLVSSVAQNVSEDIKISLCNLFKDIVFEFAKLDTPLVGACFMVLSTLLPEQKSTRLSFWFSLDTLIFRDRPLIGSTSSSYTSAFEVRLTNVSEVLGFLYLIDKLLKIDTLGDSKSEQLATFGTLEFPPKLGQGYRKVGLWPYFDYILMKIFVPSASMSNQTNREAIQHLVLQIIDTSLRSFDYSAILNSITANADLNKLVVTNSIVDYILENPATAVFNYLFDEKVFQTLFGIATVGVDFLPTELSGDASQITLLELSIKIINTTLTYQDTFIEEFLPMLMKYKTDIFFLPKYIGLKGLRSFFDAIFLNLKIVPNLALYVGAPQSALALFSLQVLKKLAVLRDGDDSGNPTKNKFMTILDTVDESSRIKDAFITQIDSPIDSDETLGLKLEILKFINENLWYSRKTATVAHLLLGFEVSSNNISLGPILSTYITSGHSCFGSIVSLLVASLAEIDPNNIQRHLITLIATSMEIILKLCRNPMTSRIVFENLSRERLFEKLVKYDPQVGKVTLWEDKVFEFGTSEEIIDFVNSGSMEAILLFLTYRNHLIDYLSLFLHHTSFSGTESQVLSYTNFLVSNATFSARIFSFLDILNYSTIPTPPEIDGKLSVFEDLRIPLDDITLNISCSGTVFNLERIDNLMHLYKRAHEQTLNSSGKFPVAGRSGTYNEVADAEVSLIKSHICYLLGNKMFEDLRLSVIKSWVQLVQIVVTDGKLSPLTRSNFVLEVFSTIVPRVNDYVELDISFSEQLVSLIVFLYEIYEKDLLMVDKHKAVDARLLDIFRVSIHGIISPLSSIFLRSDCYILANQYLTRLLREKNFNGDVLRYLRINSDQLVEVVCNDSIYGQGTSRIASILLLDALVRIGNLNRENFILENLTKTSKLLLVIRLLKDMDNILTSGDSGIDMGDFLYELGTFKAITYLLIRVAESRAGAQALVENKILQTIDSCSFLKMDPNLGVNLVFNELPGRRSGRSMVNFSLEIPLVLDEEEDTLSLFELIIPVFQLLCAILMGVGSQNKQVIWNVKKLLFSFRKLLVGIFKRDALESSAGDQKTDRASWGLGEMVKLASILCVLTGYQGEQNLLPEGSV